jgi:hypothetical protein
MAEEPEQEIIDGRQPWPIAQERLRGPALRRLSSTVDTGWYDTSLHPEQPGFCLVRDGAGDEFTELIGEVLRVQRGSREAFVYCLGARLLPPTVDLALTRRAFLSIALLSESSVSCTVEVVA